jgi:uncharacterized protein YlxW (UPF0749 family)
MHTRRNVLFLIVTVVVSVFIAQPVFASPANDLASLAQEQADLDAELDTIMQDIRKVEDDHKVCEAELAEAQAEVDSQYSSMKDRIRYMYEDGDVSLMNAMLGAKSMADFVNKAYFVSSISDYDRKMLNELEAARNVVKDKEQKLAAKKKELEKLQEDRLAKQEELAKKIERMLAKLAAANPVKSASSAGGGVVETAAPGTPITFTTAGASFTWNGSVLTRTSGVNMGPNGKETYYNMNMNGVIKIMRSMGNNDQYWVRADGAKMLGNYVIVAANLNTHPRGSIVDTSLGKGIVCDTGGFAKKNAEQIDIATSW